MSEAEKKALEAIAAVIGVAKSNFPGDCDLRIEAKGTNTASIVVPAYLLAAILKR